MDLESLSEISLLKVFGNILAKPGQLTQQDKEEIKKITEILSRRDRDQSGSRSHSS